MESNGVNYKTRYKNTKKKKYTEFYYGHIKPVRILVRFNSYVFCHVTHFAK